MCMCCLWVTLLPCNSGVHAGSSPYNGALASLAISSIRCRSIFARRGRKETRTFSSTVKQMVFCIQLVDFPSRSSIWGWVENPTIPMIRIDIPMIFPWYSWECQGFLVTPIAIAMAGQKHGEGTLIRADGGSYTGGWAEAPNDQLGSNSRTNSFQGTRPGKRLHNELERSTIFNGKTHYFDWAIFNSFLYVYQRVSEKVNIL